MLGVVVPYFNPLNDKLREKNTIEFLRYLSKFNRYVTYILIEASSTKSWLLGSNYPDSPLSGMHKNVRLHANSIIWRKENLINLAVEELPLYCDCIAWLDSDITFSHDAWPTSMMASLGTFDAVQAMEWVQLQNKDGKYGDLIPSVAREWLKGNFKPQKDHMLPGHTGMGWAMRRDLFERIGGLSEYAIVGGGDTELACSLFGRLHEIASLKSRLHFEVLKAWSAKVEEVARFNGFVAGLTIRHKWHGEESKRQYYTRAQILTRNKYDPLADTYHGCSNVLELSASGKRMQRAISDYFTARI